MSGKIKNLLGLPPFGRVVVTAFAGKDIRGKALWRCMCLDCKKEFVTSGSSLTGGRTTNCGCMRNVTHGMARGKSKTPTYRSWDGMKQRCMNPNHEHWIDYGGLGVTIEERWMVFENFLQDMKERPSLYHQLDRFPDCYGNYCKENCRWATRIEQANNKRNNRLIDFNGQIQTLAEWSKETGLLPETIGQRLKAGWSIEKALTVLRKSL